MHTVDGAPKSDIAAHELKSQISEKKGDEGSGSYRTNNISNNSALQRKAKLNVQEVGESA